MSIARALPLFSPLGCLRIKTPHYYRIHAALRAYSEEQKRARLSKRQRGQRKNKIYKQTGETNG